VEAIVLFVLVSPALAFFAGRTFLKYQELRLKNGGLGDSGERRLARLEAENRELRTRVETLETIATGGDPRSAVIAGAEAARKLRELEEEVRADAPACR
jgi:hypothetical protein